MLLIYTNQTKRNGEYFEFPCFDQQRKVMVMAGAGLTLTLSLPPLLPICLQKRTLGTGIARSLRKGE